MRSFIFSAIALMVAAPLAVSAQNQTTYYLKSNTGEYFSYSAVSRGVQTAFLVAQKNESLPAYISNGELQFVNPGLDPLPVTLDEYKVILLGYEAPTTGFSFASNGTLLVSQSDFKGFYACGDDSVYGKQLFWSDSNGPPESDCDEVSFTRVRA